MLIRYHLKVTDWNKWIKDEGEKARELKRILLHRIFGGNATVTYTLFFTFVLYTHDA